MAKYSEEFKFKVVQDYLSGPLGYTLTAKKHGIVTSQLKRWVRSYKEFGRNGLSVKKKKQFYSVQFKLDVLNFMKQTGASYQDTAIQFKMNNLSLIANWNSKFLKEGLGARHQNNSDNRVQIKSLISSEVKGFLFVCDKENLKATYL